MKILGALLICLSGLGGAYIMLRIEKVRVERSRALLKFAIALRDMIENYSLTVPQILEGCGRELLCECGYPESAPVPSDLSEFAGRCSIPDAESARIFVRFSDEFGGRGLREEIERCSFVIEALRCRCAELEEDEMARKRMRIALSLALAAALIIVFL